MTSAPLLRLTFLLLLGCALIAPVEAAEPAGEVIRIRGTVAAELDGAHRLLGIGDTVHRGELIRTAKATRIQLRLLDGSEVTLGDGTDLTIDDFVYQPERDRGNIALSLARGVFRAVSGNISKIKGSPLTVSTPIATIGIRGTDFWGVHSADQSEIALMGGTAIYIENEFGRVTIDTIGDGTTVRPGHSPSSPIKWGEQKMNAAIGSIRF